MNIKRYIKRYIYVHILKRTIKTVKIPINSYEKQNKTRHKIKWKKKSGMTWLFKQKEEAPTKISENHQKHGKL